MANLVFLYVEEICYLPKTPNDDAFDRMSMRNTLRITGLGNYSRVLSKQECCFDLIKGTLIKYEGVDLWSSTVILRDCVGCFNFRNNLYCMKSCGGIFHSNGSRCTFKFSPNITYVLNFEDDVYIYRAPILVALNENFEESTFASTRAYEVFYYGLTKKEVIDPLRKYLFFMLALKRLKIHIPKVIIYYICSWFF